MPAQAVTVLQNGTGAATFNTAGVTSYVIGQPVTFTGGTTFNPLPIQASVTTIALLRSYTVTPSIPNGAAVQVTGYYAPNDGGGGVYVWNSTSTATDNGGNVIQPTGVSTGRWILQYSGALNVRSFGAKGDSQADDTSAIQTAINYVQTAGGGTIFIPAGTYKLTATISITANRVRLIGEQVGQSLSSGTTLKQTSSTTDIISISAPSQALTGVSVQNLNLVGNSGGSTGSGIHVSSSAHTISGLYIDNVSALQCAQHGLFCEASSNFIFNGTVSNCSFTSNNGDGVNLTGGVAQLAFVSIFSNNNLNNAFNLNGTSAYNLSNVAFYRCTGSGAPSTYAGWKLHYCDAITILDSHEESNTTYDFLVLSSIGVTIEGGIVTQAGSSKGLVIGFDGTAATKNIRVSVPGWTNTTGNKRVDVTLFSGGSYYWLNFGYNADGPFTTTDINGIASIAAADSNVVQFDVKDSYTSTIGFGSMVSLVNATGKTVTSLVLQPGNWVVDGTVSYGASGTTLTQVQAGTNTTSNTIPATGLYSDENFSISSGVQTAVAPTRIYNLTAQTTVYLVAFANFTGGTVGAYGTLTAHRL